MNAPETTILNKQCNGNVVGSSQSAEERACLLPSQPFAVVYVQVRSRKSFSANKDLHNDPEPCLFIQPQLPW